MNAYYLKSTILIFTAFLPVIIGLFRYRIMDPGARIFFYLCVLSLTVESLAYYMAFRYHNNLVVYNLSSIIELFLISVYFNYTIESFRKRNIGLIIGLIGVIVGVVNNFFIQSIYRITYLFLFYQSLVIITMSIISLAAFLKPDDSRQIKNEVHFWLPVILIFFWSLSYLFFSVINFYSVRLKVVAPEIILILFLIGVLTNIAIATIFFLYPKMNHHV